MKNDQHLLKLKILRDYFGIKKENWLLKDLMDGYQSKNSQFEYSLKIINNKIKKGLRITNYMNYFPTEKSYKKRIDVLYKKTKNREELQKMMLRLSNYKLPIYYGFEQYKGDIKYKVYVNFFRIKQQQELMDAARSIFKDIHLKNRYFSLIGLDLDDKFSTVSYKVYYIYPFNHKKRDTEKKFINQLKKFSSEKFFVVSARYDSEHKLTSEKFEINLDTTLNISDIMSQLNFPNKLYKEVIKINSLVGGKPKVVIKEKDDYTIYFRL